MKLATLFLSGAMRWNIGPADPEALAITSLGGFLVINPLVFVGEPDGPQIIPFSADCCHLLVTHLVLGFPSAEASHDHLIAASGPFLRTLRLVTKQAALPTDFMGIQVLDRESLPKPVFPGAPKAKGFLIGGYRLDTAVTMRRIEEADGLGLTPDIPICHEILLDALRAGEHDDHREAILYAAIAVEALARTVLEAEYQRVLADSPPPAHTNVLTFQQAGGHLVKKDPVYAILMEGENFSRLLHEVPLYLLRKSLLQHDQELYSRTVKLYRTRNRLSHGRPIEEGDENLFSADRNGTLQSLTTAVETFRWFGASGYALPKFDQVPFGG